VKTDAELIAGVLDGQRQLFGELVRRYERSVRATAMHVLAEHSMADDAAQNAFVKAYENLSSLRRREAFGPWLMKITRRCAISVSRRMPRQSSVDSLEAFAIEDRNGQLDESKRTLLDAVMKLPENEKQVIMLHYFSGHSVKHVGIIVARSVGTVTKQLSRARKRLRSILGRLER